MRSILINVLVCYSCCLLLVNSPRWEFRVKLKFREQSSNKFKVIFVHEQQINATLKNNLFKLTMYFQTILTGIWNWMKVLQRYKVKAFYLSPILESKFSFSQMVKDVYPGTFFSHSQTTIVPITILILHANLTLLYGMYISRYCQASLNSLSQQKTHSSKPN